MRYLLIFLVGWMFFGFYKCDYHVSPREPDVYFKCCDEWVDYRDVKEIWFREIWTKHGPIRHGIQAMSDSCWNASTIEFRLECHKERWLMWNQPDSIWLKIEQAIMDSSKND